MDWILANIDPSVIVLLLGGAAGVSLLTQGAKKLFDLTNEKHVVAVFNLIAILASGLDYFLTASNLPPTIIGINTLLLTSIAHPVYIFVIKPLSTFIRNVNIYKSRVLEKVDEVAVAAGVPVVSATLEAPVIDGPILTEVTPEEVVAETTPVADF